MIKDYGVKAEKEKTKIEALKFLILDVCLFFGM
jgi:hypothetical protein